MFLVRVARQHIIMDSCRAQEMQLEWVKKWIKDREDKKEGQISRTRQDVLVLYTSIPSLCFRLLRIFTIGVLP